MNPLPKEAIAAQKDYWKTMQDMNVIPQVLNISMGFTGWRDEGTVWKIPPAGYEDLCSKARDFIKNMPADELGSKMVLLANWNLRSAGRRTNIFGVFAGVD